MNLLELLHQMLWQWCLPVFLLLTAVVCAVRMRGRPLCGLWGIFRHTIGGLFSRSDSSNALSQRQIFSTALAATMGTGNLVGTAAALAVGGPGAIVWMWVSACLGMVLVYAENRLSARYARNGLGGALAYLRYGLQSPCLTGFFAVCCIGAGLGMGNLAQTNTISSAAYALGLPKPLTAILLAVLAFVILHGGTKRIGRLTEWLMPLLCGSYFLCCLYLLCKQRSRLPDALTAMLQGACGLDAVCGGFSGTLLLQALRTGFCRGIFSNEAGLGTSSLLHMESSTPHRQGDWAVTEVFVDTLLCCTATALVLLTADISLPNPSFDGTELWLSAFTKGLGTQAKPLLAGCMICFAFATLIGWYPCGLAAMRYLGGKRCEALYLSAYVLAAFAGALSDSAAIWLLCDIANGCMALPNLTALILRSPEPHGDLTKQTKSWYNNRVYKKR